MSQKTWVQIPAWVVMSCMVSLIFLTMCFPNCKMKILEMMLLASEDLLKLNERIYFKRVQHVLKVDIFECLHVIRQSSKDFTY